MTSTEQTLNTQLDKMTDYLLNAEEIAFSESVQHWFRQGYICAITPKPLDTDALRLALKASIMERLVEVLNSPPRTGQQAAPAWCATIKGLDQPLALQSERLLEGERCCAVFAKRNLRVVEHFMFFV